jgi:hypothetical protein
MITEGIEVIHPNITDDHNSSNKVSDGIVMASDGQATARVEKTKTLGVTKNFESNCKMSFGVYIKSTIWRP